MAYPYQPWRDALQPASFAGVPFYVEVGGQSGGRRIAGHEYPKADTPFAEDMGRRARGWQVSAYLIGPAYMAARDALIAACEAEGPATFVHPTLGAFQVHCSTYAASESRERGGFAQVDLLFLEAGQNPDASATADTQTQAQSAARASGDTTAATTDANLSGRTGGGVGGINAGSGSGDPLDGASGVKGGYPSGITPGPSIRTGNNGLVVGGV